ncbi:iron complex transport system permease protein [Ochrobactrum daejeonense]|uniref:Iron complex transport system permease protein n=1 Tax=Brucella daejeonensis TaxID=659015 RepID=A0A7W9EN47_9HYPH|nr:iron ABC transporter permease [Brucella daejeonensis]MBB5702720.1 iron complex transport system permease protein [Brucella daejeonensis]
MTSQGRAAREERLAAPHSPDETKIAKSEAMSNKAAGDRASRARLTIASLVAALCVAAIFSLTAGASDASMLSVLHSLTSGTEEGAEVFRRDHLIIMEIRLPRVVMGMLIGAGLAVSGAVMQGLFRNPLADPALVGVSTGAGLGAVSMIVLGGSTLLAPVIAFLGVYALPLAAFSGGLATTSLLYRIATRRGRTSVATMLLAGIALAALAGAATGGLIYIADDRQLRDLTFWGLGSLAGSTWTKFAAAGPVIAIVLVVSPLLARGLNALALGEAAAGHLGIQVQYIKNVAIVAVAAATGATVAVAGGIGFIGIVVPHMLRLSIGPDHRYLLPAAALLGGTLLLLADAVSRTIVAPAELPIGIITALFGAPFFLWILLRQRGLLDL